MPVCANLYYSHHGESGTENPPLILIHGAGGTHLYWPPEIRRLPGYSVYALDLPGHGKSALIGGQQNISDYASHLIHWLEAMQLRRAVIVGHSMGGAIALHLAIQHADYVVGLGLISSGARLRVHPEILNFASDQTTYLKAVDMLVACSYSANASQQLVELATRRTLETRQSVFLGDLLACDRFDVMDRLGSIQQPTLVVCGAEDQMTPLRYAQYLANSIPHAQLSIIPNAGHMVMLEQPALLAASLLSFLQGVSFTPGEGV
jgi:pimeloyl-ACP methyl ester carboxylesterase